MGDHNSNVSEALRSAEAALAIFQPGTFGWALAINNRGVALENLENDEYPKNLLAALTCFESALEVFDRPRYPNLWSMVMLNLGNTYGRLGDPDHARQAISFFKQSQEVRDRRLYPREWAETTLGLSSAYMLGPSSSRVADFKQAIVLAQSALQVVKRDENTWLWAQLSRNIAVSLGELGEHRKALATYNVLVNQVPDLFEGKSAGILFYNRANSCAELSGQHHRGLLLDAISSYDRALTFVNEQVQPELWGMIMHNRGMAYLYLPDKDRRHVDSAIQSFDSALRVRLQDRDPIAWANTMLSKGMALLALGTKDDTIAAINCFERSLQVFTKDQYPAQWRMATGLRDKALGGLSRKSLPKAVI